MTRVLGLALFSTAILTTLAAQPLITTIAGTAFVFNGDGQSANRARS
jgi:hypothetical protein